jgi:hypothetical protein
MCNCSSTSMHKTPMTSYSMQNRLRKQLSHTLRMANKAQQKLREVADDDDETAGGITQLIEEALNKHEAIRAEMGTYGVTVPMSAGLTDSLSTPGGTVGRKMQMERQVGDIQEACKQLQVCHTANPVPYDFRPALQPSPTPPSQYWPRASAVCACAVKVVILCHRIRAVHGCAPLSSAGVDGQPCAREIASRPATTMLCYSRWFHLETTCSPPCAYPVHVLTYTTRHRRVTGCCAHRTNGLNKPRTCRR